MQVDSMDNGLRNRLWNALCIHYWKEVKLSSFDGSFYYNIPETIHLLNLTIGIFSHYEPKLTP